MRLLYRAQLNGFNALASTSRQPRAASTDLRKGPAFGTTGPVAAKEDWPTFRGNPIRSGSTPTSASANPHREWTTQLGGKLTQPIIAAGKIFVASVHQQTLYALDEATGKLLWQYTADGRIDSPPTYHKGVLYFGTRSGRIHALAAADGREVWQHRIAPTEDQIISYNQLESVWPVHGSTLVVDDVVYAAAGRNVYLDGGIHAVGLDCVTGKVRYKAHFNTEPQDPTVDDEGDDHYMLGAAIDIMQHDGTHLYLGSMVLDKALQEQQTSQPKRLHASAGFLDDLTYNRDIWTYSAQRPGFWERKLHNHVFPDNSWSTIRILCGAFNITSITAARVHSTIPAKLATGCFARLVDGSGTGFQDSQQAAKRGQEKERNKKDHGGLEAPEARRCLAIQDPASRSRHGQSRGHPLCRRPAGRDRQERPARTI